MPNLWDQLYDTEHRLEQAREAGNPNAIHDLTKERQSIQAQINAQHTRGPHH